jgi:hypothetical protein
MSKLFIYLLLCLYSIPVFAGNDFLRQGAASAALGGSATTLVNAFSIGNNQGAAAFLDRPLFGAAFQSSYLPASVSNMSLSAVLPFKPGTFGGSLVYFGNDLYYEMKAGLACAMMLGNKTGLGIQLDYLHSKANGYAGRHFVTFEIGLLYHPAEAVSIGVHVFNPVKYKVSEMTDEILPVVMSVGLMYRPHEQISLLFELQKDIDHPFDLSMRLAFQATGELVVRGGFSSHPAVLSFGLGYEIKDALLIDVTGDYHLDLGFRIGASLSFQLKKADEIKP